MIHKCIVEGIYICRLYWTKTGYLHAGRGCNRTHNLLPLPLSTPCNHVHDIYTRAVWISLYDAKASPKRRMCLTNWLLYLQDLRHQLRTSSETRSSPALVTAAWILPISVLMPVATTQAVHAPLDTVVDEKSTFIFSCEIWKRSVNNNNYGLVMAKSDECGTWIFHYDFCDFFNFRKCSSAVGI